MQLNIDLSVANLKKKVALTGRTSLALPLQSTASKIRDDILTRVFANEETPRGEAWADLAPSTWARKRTNRKLFETGRLIKSIKIVGDRSGLRMSASAPYASFHHFGTNRMPARRFFDFPPAYSEIFLKAARKHLKAKGRRK